MKRFGAQFRVLAAGVFASAAALAYAEAPRWSDQQGLSGVPSAKVVCLDKSEAAELIVLKPDQGLLRIGATYGIYRGESLIGTAVVAEGANGMNVALPVGECPAQAGDTALPQTTK